VNLSFLLCLATCRTRSSAWDTLSRSCARRVLCWLAFPSAPALGSTDSAASRLALFVGFTATMAGSDFSRPYISGDGSSPSHCGPTSLCVIGRTRDLPVPEQRASAHARVSDHAGPSGHSRSRARLCCLPRSETRRHPGSHFFRGSMAGLRAPLPTLRRHPRGCQRTARGRGGFATPSSWRTCTPYSLPVSRRTQIKSKLLHIMRIAEPKVRIHSPPAESLLRT